MASWHDEDVNVEPLIGSLTIGCVPPAHGIFHLGRLANRQARGLILGNQANSKGLLTQSLVYCSYIINLVLAVVGIFRANFSWLR